MFIVRIIKKNPSKCIQRDNFNKNIIFILKNYKICFKASYTASEI